MGTKRIAAADIVAVFEAWKSRQRRPALCRLTEERRRLIRARLGLGYDRDDLIALFDYIWASSDAGPRWMRGDNPGGKPYLDLDNLLRVGKLASRIESALNWQADNRPNVDADADNLGPFRLIKGGAGGLD
jgi:hypothetical protein